MTNGCSDLASTSASRRSIGLRQSFTPKGSAAVFKTVLLATECTDQSADLTVQDEPAHDTRPGQIEAPRVRALPPQFDQCCYPIGEPRTPGFRYCAAPIAQPGAVYCLEHKRLCMRDIAA
jgi:hypothetical protein